MGRGYTKEDPSTPICACKVCFGCHVFCFWTQDDGHQPGHTPAFREPPIFLLSSGSFSRSSQLRWNCWGQRHPKALRSSGHPKARSSNIYPIPPPPQAIPWNLRLERRWKIDVLPLRLIALCVPAKWHVQDDSSTLHDHVDGKTSEEPLVLGLKHRTKIPGVQKGSQA